MLVALLVWLCLSPLAWIAGHAALAALAALARLPDGREPGPAVTSLAGLGVLSTAAAVLGLFGPVARGAQLAVAVLGIAALVGQRVALGRVLSRSRGRWRDLPLSGRILAAALFAIVLWCSAATAGIFDTGLYHAQSILWIQREGVVPGLGNLHPPLVLTYPWFALSALADLSSFGLPRTHVHAGLVLLLFLAMAVARLRRWQEGRTASALLALGCGAYGLHVFANWVSSPTPDVAATVVVWAVGVLLLEALECSGRVEPDRHGLAIVLLCAQGVTYKLALAPLMLAPLVLAVLWSRSRSRAWRAVAAAGLVTLAPFLIQTVVETGYLVHPFPALDLFAFDWKMPRAVVVEQADWVYSWSRLPGLEPGVVLRMSHAEWLPAWWRAMPASYRGLLAASLLPLPFYAAWWTGAGRARRYLAQAGLVALTSLGLAFWFVTAPDPRYGIGFFTLQGVLLLAWPLSRAGRRVGSTALTLAWLAAIAFQVPGFTLRTRLEGRGLTERVWIPERDPAGNLRAVQARGFAGSEPVKGKLCWYDGFPCAPQRLKRVEARGPTLASGFRSLPGAP